jgi:cation diffusion facilitator family transporter
MNGVPLTRFAWLSIATALATIALKLVAYWMTASVGLLADALESCVNLAGGVIALIALTVAARVPDTDRPFGYDKAEYFASGAEGALILIAAAGIAISAIERLINPQPIGQLAAGIGVSIIATCANLFASLTLARAGARHQSIALTADAQHLMTDVWTSVGVIIAVAAVALTGWQWLDPAIALVVAANIVWTGSRLIGRSIAGLMDTALPLAEREMLEYLLANLAPQGIRYHLLRTRAAGARRFISVHLLVPADWTVQHGHDVAEDLEQAIAARLANTTVLIHVEPIDDARAYGDGADRPSPANLPAT